MYSDVERKPMTLLLDEDNGKDVPIVSTNWFVDPFPQGTEMFIDFIDPNTLQETCTADQANKELVDAVYLSLTRVESVHADHLDVH